MTAVPTLPPLGDAAGETGRCVWCGRMDRRCLCRRCRLALVAAFGALPIYVADWQRDAKRRTMAVVRAARRGRGEVPADAADFVTTGLLG